MSPTELDVTDRSYEEVEGYIGVATIPGAQGEGIRQERVVDREIKRRK